MARIHCSPARAQFKISKHQHRSYQCRDPARDRPWLRRHNRRDCHHQRWTANAKCQASHHNSPTAVALLMDPLRHFCPVYHAPAFRTDGHGQPGQVVLAPETAKPTIRCWGSRLTRFLHHHAGSRELRKPLPNIGLRPPAMPPTESVFRAGSSNPQSTEGGR